MSGRFLAIAGASMLIAGLLIALVFQMRQVSARDKLISNRENRADQVAASMVQFQARIEVDKTNAERVQQKLNEATQRISDLTAAADKLAATATQNQRLLDQTRTDGAKFQTGMAAANVASLEQKGLAQVAQTEANVRQVQLKQATDSTAQLQQDLAAAKLEIAALRDQLQKAKDMIGSLP